MAAESVRIAGTVEPLCNINGSSRSPLSLSSSARRLAFRRGRRCVSSSVSSSLSEFFGSVRIRNFTPSSVQTLQQRRRNFSVFAMAADGIDVFSLWSVLVCLIVFCMSWMDCFVAEFCDLELS